MYFSPKKNVLYDIHVFRQAKQNQEETLDQFYTRLCQLAQTCEFTDPTAEIKIQLMENCSSSRLRRKALREDITLDALLQYGRSLERSDSQLKAIEDGHNRPVLVNEMQQLRVNNSRRRVNNPSNQLCYFCGEGYPHKSGRKSCSAADKTYHKCGKIGHFGRVCKSQPNQKSAFLNRRQDKRRNAMNLEHEPGTTNTSDSDSDNEYTFTVKTVQSTKTSTDISNVNKLNLPKQLPMSTVTIGTERMEVLIDSGASVNILSSHDFDTINQSTYDQPN